MEVVRYNTPQFLLRSTLRFFCNVTVRLVCHGTGTLFELKIPDFSQIGPDFRTQWQKTVKADAKCVN